MRTIKYISIAIICVLVFYFISFQKNDKYITLHGQTMGTFYNIKILAPNRHIPESLPAEIEKELAKVNQQMSVFIEDSEINQINRLPAQKELKLSSDMSILLNDAQKIYHKSRGAFDPSVAPLVELWGFGRGNISHLPQKAEIEKSLQSVGFDKIKLNKTKHTLYKTISSTTLNLSAIAKGYGVDKIAQVLDNNQINNYVIEIGGEIRTKGHKDDRQSPWRISLTAPIGNGEGSAYILNLTDQSVATSGNYRNYHQVGNKRLSHSISPQTGMPIDNNMLSVTVITSNCMEADAYATAIMILGKDKGLKLAEQENLAVILFTEDENGHISSHISSLAQKFIEKSNK